MAKANPKKAPEHTNSEAVAKSYVERLSRLFGEIEALQSDVKEVGEDAKNAGFDVKALKKVAKLLAKDAEKVEEERVHIFNVVAYAKAVQLDLDIGETAIGAAAALSKLGGGTLTGPGVTVKIKGGKAPEFT